MQITYMTFGVMVGMVAMVGMMSTLYKRGYSLDELFEQVLGK